MSTKPRAKKFRIRRSGPAPLDPARRAGVAGEAPAPQGGPTAAGAQPVDDQMFAPSDADDGFGDAPFPTAAAAGAGTGAGTGAGAGAAKPALVEEAPEETLAEIRKEGLTGRQLRMARRVAQKHGLAPTSDFDAVRLLRAKGIDPFQRTGALELVVSPQGDGATMSTADARAMPAGAGVPQTVPKPKLPATEVLTEDTRAKEIIRMQRDIVRRRRRKLIQLVTRLGFFVLLPTFLAGHYFYVTATPMFSTKSEFVIQQAQPANGAAGGLGGLFTGTSFATSQDSIAVQGYLGSLDAMLRLEQDLGFISHFSDERIDPLQRLEIDATKEQAYKVFKKKVLISYDPTEGLIKMEVIAADPQVAQSFAERLISYAEEQVDNLTQRLREDQMSGALKSLSEAEKKLLSAQAKVLEIQQKLGVLDPVTESQALMTQITSFETQLQEKKLQLAQLQSNARPNSARVEGTEGDIARLSSLIEELRSQLTQNSSSSESLAFITGQLRLAEADLQTRQALVTQAVQQLETARIEANRQTRYLENSVKPIVPDTASYPRAFENTILAFLIFGGIYMMFSLTASILREQVSA
ncbi:Capsule polysaccharide export inner-membrane protein [Candidatus Rhodobacter oscarellae]|uniref:Capsule polysaccharide export inner-membrane protein n=1 Tax=Candidatus Rhodobacter oscarellae TaxID=1675527 RepID=A0A0J9GVK5_9RHOB|nr:capsule biosynthesis protein [Candidatus Rhodobacter lobularis]KMW57593.1 Capsule polysaccharide export inner-membrane protein [Candidatus Rhodobacter lobularis]